MGQAGLHHLVEVVLNIGCFRGGDVKARIQHFFANAGAHGRDHPRLNASTAHDVIDHGGCGCFAIRTGHANHAQLSRGEVMQRRSKVSYRTVHITFHLHIRHGQIFGCWPVAHHSNSPSCQRLRDIVKTISVFPFERCKQHPGLHLA